MTPHFKCWQLARICFKSTAGKTQAVASEPADRSCPAPGYPGTVSALVRGHGSSGPLFLQVLPTIPQALHPHDPGVWPLTSTDEHGSTAPPHHPPKLGTQSLCGNFTTFICGACAWSRKYLLPLPLTVGGKGAAKNRDIPPYCTRTLYTGPPGPGRRDSWHILGSLFRNGRGDWGGITRERGTSGGHSGPGYWSRHFLVLGSSLVPPPAPSPPQQRPPYLARPLASILASGCPPLAPGDSVLPSQSGGPKGGYGFSETPWEPCHSCSHRARDACGRSSCINTGMGEGPPPESLREFADDADQGCVLILEPLVVSPEVGQGLWDGMGWVSWVAPDQWNPLPTVPP